MWEVVLDGLNGVIAIITAGADPAIAGFCGVAFGYIFGPVAGMALGWVMAKSLLEDDLAPAASRVFWTVVTLSIVLWFIKPGGGSCHSVDVKNGFLQMQSKLVNAVAPGYGDGDALIRKIVEDTRGSIGGFLGKAVEKMNTSAPAPAAPAPAK